MGDGKRESSKLVIPNFLLIIFYLSPRFTVFFYSLQLLQKISLKVFIFNWIVDSLFQNKPDKINSRTSVLFI